MFSQLLVSLVWALLFPSPCPKTCRYVEWLLSGGPRCEAVRKLVWHGALSWTGVPPGVNDLILCPVLLGQAPHATVTLTQDNAVTED